MPESARHGQVGVATGLGKNLHFRIDATEAPVGGVGKREISVHKSVAGTSGTFLECKAAMAKRQPVAEFREDAAGVFRSVGMWNSGMQMDLDFSRASVRLLRNPYDVFWV